MVSLVEKNERLLALGSTGVGKLDKLAVRKRKEDMIEGLMESHRQNSEKNGVPVLSGTGRFVGSKTVEITSKNPSSTEFVSADKIVLCVGSTAAITEIAGLKDATPLTHVETLDISVVPEHPIILDGGYVGLEFAQAMRRLGGQVTIMERGASILKREDKDVVECLQNVLEGEGIRISAGTVVDRISGHSGSAATLECRKSGTPFSVSGSHILCATGCVPNTSAISADIAGIELTHSGHFAVDEHNRTTTAAEIFAVGDCASSPYFMHIGFDDFRIVRDVLLGKASTATRRSERQVPFTLFTDPELAHVGLREHEAQALGTSYRMAKLPVMAFVRTRTLGETTGFAKALIADDDTILGLTAVGSGAGELLPAVQLAMKKGLPCTDIADFVIVQPTSNEGLASLFGSVAAKS